MNNLYFETDYIKISWDSELQAVVSEWIGYLGGGTGKTQISHTKIAELLTQHTAKKWLSDTRSLKVTDQADQDWIAEVGQKLLVRAGLRYVAIVLPQSAIANLSLNRILKRIEDFDLELSNHATLEEAKFWLNSKK